MKLPEPTVVNNVLEHFRFHPDEGCIIDFVPRLPNPEPHPVPNARSLNDTCITLRIDKSWAFCNRHRVELEFLLPSTTHFVSVAIFNAFIDNGHCHPDVPGTVFTPRTTFHFQRWTPKNCNNDPIRRIPTIYPEYQHSELIDSIGNYLSAPGHFGPQQLPRLIRLLATSPETAKVLVAKGGVADMLVDILIDRGVVERNRIIRYDHELRPFHLANIVYRSESSPYLKDPNNDHFIHDRTDMQLIHRVISAEPLAANLKPNRIILIKRLEKSPRSIIEHEELWRLMRVILEQSALSSRYHLAIFKAEGHMRDHVALFRQARVIIGSHGAGMMNIAWASPGTHVVEIGYTLGMAFPEMYAEMSLHLDQIYWICKGYGDYSHPIHVDIEDFQYIYRRILDQIETSDATIK